MAKQNKGSNSNGKPNNKPQSRRQNRQRTNTYKPYPVLAESDNAKLVKGTRDNDPNWYFNNEELAKQGAELSFQSFIGGGPLTGDYSVPAIGAFYLNPCPGQYYYVPDQMGSDDADNGVAVSTTNAPKYSPNGLNLMSTKIYTLLSTYSGRSSSYAPQDVGIMLLAIASFAEMSEHLRRIFGVALTYNPRNRAVPKALIKAMGCNPDDLFENISNYRMRFNVSINRINQIPLLDNVGFIRKSREIYQRVYVDASTSMAQIYLYAPASVWMLDETTDDKGSWLQTVPITVDNADVVHPTVIVKTMAELLTIFEQMVDTLLTSSNLNIIYADLLNLGSKVNVPFWKFDYLAENYVVMPEYNANALLQIHNMDIVGTPYKFGGTTRKVTSNGVTYTTNNDVFCDPDNNAVLYNPVFPMYDTVAKRVVDMFTDNPTLEDRIEALRFKVVSPRAYTHHTFGGTAVDKMSFMALPDHYCVMWAIGTAWDSPVCYNRNTHLDDYDVFKSHVGELSQFSSHPLFYEVYDGTATNTMKGIVDMITGDLEYSTEVNYEYLVRLNRLVYTGLFDFRM